MADNQHIPENFTQSLNQAVEGAPESLPQNISTDFLKADAFTALHEGGITKDDGNKHTAAFGIDQTAHPNMDVTSVTPERAQAMRYEYWRAIGGDELAKKNSSLATAAYDTAIMSGPDRANEFLKNSHDDPRQFIQQRSDFFHKLERNPAYSRASAGWEARNRDLQVEIGKASKLSSSSPQENKYSKRKPRITASRSEGLKKMFT